MNTTRRTILAGLAALPLAPASAGAVSPTVDPIFALIEAHRAAFTAFNDALTADCDSAPAEDAAKAAAMGALVEQEPTTLAGLGAMSAYLDAHVKRTGDHEPAVWARATIAEACRRLTGGEA